MILFCLDLEGVLIPEIWIHVAQKTKTDELLLTTRDIPDYDVLMKHRLRVLRKRKIKLRDIQRIIAGMQPIPGARKFLGQLRLKAPVIILSDTYYEFAMPLVKKLGAPSLFCNWLETDAQGFIRRYCLRQRNGKEKAVRAVKKIGFEVRAAGDSFNDITMLKAADKAVLFRPPPKIVKQFPKFPVAYSHHQLLKKLTEHKKTRK